MEMEVITRKWGNSIAVVIPRELVKKENIKENQEMKINLQKKRPKAGGLFGRFPELKKWSTQELKDEMRRGWLSKSDREREKKWKM